jgi:hypothetical protein
VTSTFDEVVASTPWRTDLLIATIDGVRLWALSDGDVEWVLPAHFTNDDLSRLRRWLRDDQLARLAGQPKPAYLDYMRPDAPRVPITADEMAGLVGFPPDGVNLQQLLDGAADVSEEGQGTDELAGGDMGADGGPDAEV